MKLKILLFVFLLFSSWSAVFFIGLVWSRLSLKQEDSLINKKVKLTSQVKKSSQVNKEIKNKEKVKNSEIIMPTRGDIISKNKANNTDKTNILPSSVVNKAKSKVNEGVLKLTNISFLKNKYTIEIGAFKNEVKARSFAFKLYLDGFSDTYYREIKQPDGSIWYKVYIGFFNKKETAELFAIMLKKQKKISSYYIRKVE